MSEEERPVIRVPDLCYKHYYELVHTAKFTKTDPWGALTVIANAAMFQGATATQTVWNKLEGDVTRITELGCLACRLPHRFKKVLEVAKTRDLGKIKELGEKWVNEAKIDPNANSRTETEDTGTGSDNSI
jgi:hypothetical protein